MAVEPSSAKKRKTEDDFEPPGNYEKLSSFAEFEFCKLLKNDMRSKTAFIHAKCRGKEAVLLMEKRAFEPKTVQNLLSEKTELVETLKNDIYSTYNTYPEKELNGLKTTLIFPATSHHIMKYTEQDFHIIHESAGDYNKITLPYIKNKALSNQWVYNILNKKTEADRIIFEDSCSETGFILLPDMKWDRQDVTALYLQAIVHRRDIMSIRDLDKSHLPLLRNISEKGLGAIKEKFGIPGNKIRIYFHYQPSYYHLHVHFAHIKLDNPGFEADRAHLLMDVIENIETKSLYYKEKTLVFKVREDDILYKDFLDHGCIHK
ncbi:m7GpppX diphosphatase-like [Saccostrea echinata]|uniref:m7GpppX diphosphatase-like n=1 Tax=Saccostrea echinata TaxID=191078 RepID=UPI002A838784|nr:m7GpppX diphosphatase-like [Saccostrea echinata]